jgi:16S rRNA (cytosine967-C5)-methyltransferase
MDISTEPRLLAVEVLSRVEKHNAYANISFDAVSYRGNIPVKVKSLGKELLFGVLRNRTRLENAISRFLRHPLKQSHPFVRRQLLIGAYQILFLDNIPDAIVVDRAVELVKLKLGNSPSKFVNAILRKLIREGELPYDESKSPLDCIINRYSYPKWIAEIMIESTTKENAVELAKSLNMRAKTILRSNTLKNSRDELLSLLEKNFPEIEITPTSSSPVGIEVRKLADPIRQDLHRQGHYLIQDESSQLVSYFVDPKPNTTVLDACAGTGGKSLHMAALMENQGSILATDLKHSKMDALKQRAKRASSSIITTQTMDLLGELPDSQFDTVLLDAPCSGLGVLRRHPEAKWRLKPINIKEVIEKQRAMIHGLSSMVKPGGLLAYIVCTFNIKETHDIVKWFLETHKEFELAPPPTCGGIDWKSLLNSDGTMSLWPHINNSDGFFGARFIKSASGKKEN